MFVTKRPSVQERQVRGDHLDILNAHMDPYQAVAVVTVFSDGAIGMQTDTHHIIFSSEKEFLDNYNSVRKHMRS